jgi:hypothetical protein
MREQRSGRLGSARGWIMAVVVLLACVLPSVATAQPFGAWFVAFGDPQHGYIEVPHRPVLNITSKFTFEAWVSSNLADGPSEDCRSIAGKNYQQAWWLGICNIGGKRTLRSYIRGGGSSRNGGLVPPGQWNHLALVFDGNRRQHYINGELVFDIADPGAMTKSPGEPLRFFSDRAWQHTPAGAIDEVRIWKVARTQEQIRQFINTTNLTGQTGLVGRWALDANANANKPALHGTVNGSGTGFLNFPVTFDCGASTATHLCLHDRFSIAAKARAGAPGTAFTQAGVAASSPSNQAGVFYFFSPDNLEVLVKVLNNCALNNRYWVFSSTTSVVFYRMDVTDVRAGANKVYFNYPGPPAPAVLDTSAFATCP